MIEQNKPLMKGVCFVTEEACYLAYIEEIFQIIQNLSDDIKSYQQAKMAKGAYLRNFPVRNVLALPTSMQEMDRGFVME